MNGKGKMVWKDGKIFEGSFINDKKNGQGIMQYPNGKKVEGNWVNGKLDGDANAETKKKK